MKHLFSLLACCLAAAGSMAQTLVIEYGNDIVRVLKGKDHTSYSVVRTPEKAQQPSFHYEVDSEGRVTFRDLQGHILLRETDSHTTPITEGPNAGFAAVSQTWRLDKDEVLLGLGQLKDPVLNLRGKDIRIWNDYTVITIPYLASSKGYGIYWDNAGEGRFRDNRHGTTFSSEVATGIDYYFIYHDGTQDGLMQGVRQLSGQATMYPLWTTGYWQCRERYKSPEELLGVVDEYRRREVPLDGIVQDWQYWGPDSNWNAMRFDNPNYTDKSQQMVDDVHARHAHIMISIWPDFGPQTKQYQDLQKMGALLPFETWPMNCGARVMDVFNPKAREMYWRHLSEMYKMGFDAWWTDSTEPDQKSAPDDNNFLTHDGTWRAVHNAFPMATNRSIYEHMRKKPNGKRAFNMTRSGTFGLQHYGTLCWSGDVQSTWEEMRGQVTSGLNFVMCGNPYWNTDLGGFFCWDYHNNPHDAFAKELNTRWHQWGTFQPLMRSHCSSPMVCEIYQFGDEGDWAYDAIKEAIKLRYRLMPYIYSTEGEVMLKGTTIMRPFVFDFPHDSVAIRRGDEYMFGRNLLVKPVTEPLYTWQDEHRHGHAIHPDVKGMVRTVEVYLPQGTKWYNFWTNDVSEGGRTYQVEAPIDETPLFVRAGTILPWGPEVQYAGQKDWQTLELRLYPGADGDFTLYEDEGDGYAYEQGAYSLIPIHWDEASHTLTIGQRQGSYKGMLTQRAFVVTCEGSTVIGQRSTTHTIPYSGAAITVSLE